MSPEYLRQLCNCQFSSSIQTVNQFGYHLVKFSLSEAFIDGKFLILQEKGWDGKEVWTSQYLLKECAFSGRLEILFIHISQLCQSIAHFDQLLEHRTWIWKGVCIARSYIFQRNL